MSDAKLADVIEVRRQEILIDGKEFPWFTSERGVEVTVARDIPAITVTIVANEVRVIDSIKDEKA